VPPHGAAVVTYRRLVVLATGGTISSRVDESGSAVRALDARSLISTVPRPSGVSLRPIDFSADYTIGFNVTPHIMLRLAQGVDALAGEPDVDGVIVTHGTDVMEEVATFVDLAVTTEKAVIFTGAMRNASLPGADGPHNLANAIQVAAHPETSGRGVLVCMNEEMHSARTVTKRHTTQISAFASPGRGPVGVVGGEHVTFFSPPSRGRRYAVTSFLPEVPLVWVAAGAGAAQIEAALLDAPGAVLAATGIGHVPSWWMPAIRRGIAAGTQVVMASRCGSGTTGLGYGGLGGDLDLADAGVMFAGNRRPLQTRIELICALSAGLRPGEIRSAFEAELPRSSDERAS